MGIALPHLQIWDLLTHSSGQQCGLYCVPRQSAGHATAVGGQGQLSHSFDHRDSSPAVSGIDGCSSSSLPRLPQDSPVIGDSFPMLTTWALAQPNLHKQSWLYYAAQMTFTACSLVLQLNQDGTAPLLLLPRSQFSHLPQAMMGRRRGDASLSSPCSHMVDERWNQVSHSDNLRVGSPMLSSTGSAVLCCPNEVQESLE